MRLRVRGDWGEDVLGDDCRERLELAAGFRLTDQQWLDVQGGTRMVFAHLPQTEPLTADQRDLLLLLEKACDRLVFLTRQIDDDLRIKMLSLYGGPVGQSDAVRRLRSAVLAVGDRYEIRKQGDRYSGCNRVGFGSLKKTFMISAARCSKESRFRHFIEEWIKCLPESNRDLLKQRSSASLISYVSSEQVDGKLTDPIAASDWYQSEEISGHLIIIEQEGGIDLSGLTQTGEHWTVDGLMNSKPTRWHFQTLYDQPIDLVFVFNRADSYDLLTCTQPSIPRRVNEPGWRFCYAVSVRSWIRMLDDYSSETAEADLERLRSDGYLIRVSDEQFASLKDDIWI